MKKLILIIFLVCLSYVAYAQNTALFNAIETAVLQKGVKIMVWEDEYSPSNDIRPWGTQKQECVNAWGANTTQGKLIAQASTEEYVAVANQIRGTLMQTKYNFAGKLRAMAKDANKWTTMKKAYQSACFSVIREMYAKQYNDGLMNAVGNWLLSSEMVKAGEVIDGTRLAPVAEGAKCSAATLASLKPNNSQVLIPNKTKVALKTDLNQWVRVCYDCQSLKYASIDHSLVAYQSANSNPDNWAVFTVEHQDGKIRLKTQGNKYLSHCDCRKNGDPGIIMIATLELKNGKVGAEGLFDFEKLPNGKYKIKTSSGKYWSRYQPKDQVDLKNDVRHVIAAYVSADRTLGSTEFELVEVSSDRPSVSIQNFKFLASADPQYESADLELKDFKWVSKPNTEAAKSDVTFSRMIQNMDDDPSIKGIIIAGDLTQNSRVVEFEHYKDVIAFRNKTAHIYEGIGNHDNFNTAIGKVTVNPKAIHDYVRTKSRATPVNASASKYRHYISDGPGLPVNWNDNYVIPHYSWDWNNVHFVQLNLYPGNGQGAKFRSYDTHGEYGYHSPLNSLDFLVSDLNKHVGNSGRPVILIHHYGFDDFTISNNWWTEDERQAYWDALVKYNVVAILTGHLHCLGCDNNQENTPFYIPWNKPIGSASNQYYGDTLNTFLVGGMKHGEYYSEFEFKDGKLTARKFKGPGRRRAANGQDKSFTIK